MTILDEIVLYKKEFVKAQKFEFSFSDLEKRRYFNRNTYSISKALKNEKSTGIIAEFKRKSPSKGMINEHADVQKVTSGYVRAGATALSVLTDEKYFGGSDENLLKAREVNECPILRKEFMIDEFQVVEAKSLGADLILLIAAILTKKEATHLTKVAHSLGLEVLIEIHNEMELLNVPDDVNVIGVNNRNLKTFEVSIDTSIALSEKIGNNKIKISESGISDPKNIIKLKEYGYQGFLIGENFMKTSDPGKACEEFIKQF